MNSARWAFAILVSMATAPVWAGPHECTVNLSWQVYERTTLKLKEVKTATTGWRPVTDAPHEDAVELEVRTADASTLARASVWTGTLPETADGPVIQAHARMSAAGQDANVSLMMSTKSPVAAAYDVIEAESDTTLELLTVELKCRKHVP